MTLPFRSTLIALICCLPLTAAQAHDVWLLPSTTILSKAGYVTVDAAVSNQTFHFEYRPLQLRDNLSIVAPDGTSLAAENLTQGKLRTVFDVHLEQPGTYRLAVVNDGVMASWKDGGENKRWRGKAADFAINVPKNASALEVREVVSRVETFVTLGAPEPVRPLESGLELVPVTHPNDLFAGEPASFRFLVDGKPAAGVEVTIMRGGTRYRNEPEKTTLVAGADGAFTYTWPEAGMYWLDADVQDDRTRLSEAKERRLGYTATLEVLPQ